MIRRQRQADPEELSCANVEPSSDDIAPTRKIALGPRLPVPAYRGNAFEFVLSVYVFCSLTIISG
jgi:hypothetical protein